MLDVVNSISSNASLPIFVTLTLPDSEFDPIPTEFAKKAKSYLDVWLKRFDRVCPQNSLIWKMDWKPRLSGLHFGEWFPHFHLLVWGVECVEPGLDEKGKVIREPFVRVPDRQVHFDFCNTFRESLSAPTNNGQLSSSDQQERDAADNGSHSSSVHDLVDPSPPPRSQRLMGRLDVAESVCVALESGAVPATAYLSMSFFDWVSLSWYHVVGSGDGKHFLAGVQVSPVRSLAGCGFYSAHYMAKTVDGLNLYNTPLGRQWGIHNRSRLPWAKIIELDLDEETGVRLRRIARRYLERKTGRRRRCPYGVTLYCNTAIFKSYLSRPPDNPF